MALPDLIEIVPLTEPVRAEITVPGSKSITNRALILAALSDGETILRGALWSEDTQIMVECLQELGFMVNVEPDPAEPCNRTITVYGNGGAVAPGGTESQPLELYVGNAGTAARFLMAFVCLGRGIYRLSGVPRMHERPQAALFQALRELGYHVEAENGNDKLPVKISHGDTENTEKIKSGSAPSVPLRQERKCTVSIAESSQFASALLLCAKQGGWNIEITGENAEESPYVEMTRQMLKVFPGGGEFRIEPDASSGSYFWATEKHVSVACWPRSGWQIDAMFPNFIPLPECVSRQSQLGDSIMTAITLAPFANQQVKFTDLGRLRVQECERVVALRTELTKCGAKVVEEGDTLTVWPSQLHGAEIETYNDHRIAMCFAVLGLKVPGIKIKNPSCVKKTFPNFFQKLAGLPPHGLGAEIWEIKDGNRSQKLSGKDLFAD
jgi:3-phosphoshikimate 1-carboxyvinyltransferase